MRKTISAMSAVVLLLAVLALLQGGIDMLIDGIMAGLKMFWGAAVLLLAAFSLSGLVQVLIDPQKVGMLLGKGAGLRGIMLGLMAGVITPGGPYVYYPISHSFLSAGAEASTLVSYIVAKSLLDVTRAPMEVAIMGAPVTIVRHLVTLIFPLVAGLLARIFYPTLMEKMMSVPREGIRR